MPYVLSEKQRSYQREWAERRRRANGVAPRPVGYDPVKNRERKKRFKKAHPEKIRAWKKREYSNRTYGKLGVFHRDLLALKAQLQLMKDE